MTVRAILKAKGRRVVTVRQDMPIGEVVATLSREKIGAVVISDDGATVAGLLSERDIIRGLAEHGAKLPSLTARDLITIAVSAQIIATLGGVLPALWAARLEPVEALRHE